MLHNWVRKGPLTTELSIPLFSLNWISPWNIGWNFHISSKLQVVAQNRNFKCEDKLLYQLPKSYKDKFCWNPCIHPFIKRRVRLNDWKEWPPPLTWSWRPDFHCLFMGDKPKCTKCTFHVLGSLDYTRQQPIWYIPLLPTDVDTLCNVDSTIGSYKAKINVFPGQPLPPLAPTNDTKHSFPCKELVFQ